MSILTSEPTVILVRLIIVGIIIITRDICHKEAYHRKHGNSDQLHGDTGKQIFTFMLARSNKRENRTNSVSPEKSV